MAGHVFVSYSRRDSEYVTALVAHLATNGIPIWVDDKIPLGSRWEHEIRNQIDTCAAVVVVMTPDSATSTWVANELERAKAKDKPILPLLLAGEVFFSLGHIQAEMVTGGRMPAPKFLVRLRELVGGPHTVHAGRDVRAPRRSIGIDLGMRNTVVCLLENEKPTLVPNTEGSLTTPMVVAVDMTGGVLIGEEARRYAVIKPGRTARREWSWSLDIDNTTYGAPRLLEFVLARIKLDAESYLGETMPEAVLTVPACFDSAKRQASRQAAEAAGISVRQVLSATTAAALAVAMARPSTKQTALIVRLDSASFDACVVRIASGVVDVIASTGDDGLGTDAWNARVIDHVLSTVRSSHDINLANDAVAMERVRLAAEKASLELSSNETTSIILPFLASLPDGAALHLDTMLTRPELETMSDDLLLRCQSLLALTLSEARAQTNGIDRVVLVGGSARMPALIELIRVTVGRDPDPDADPGQVAIGAAWQAALLRGDADRFRVRDRVALGLIVEAEGSNAARLIEPNASLPATASVIVTTFGDDQESTSIRVRQYSADDADVRDLGTYGLLGIPPGPAGFPELEVTTDVNNDGIVTVSAKELRSDTQLTVTPTGALEPAHLTRTEGRDPRATDR